MKKHIIGFAMFSFIVASAVFVKYYFYTPESFDVPAPAVKSSCWKMKREFKASEAPIVRQALLNLNTKQMNWEVYVPETETRLALHFFIKDGGDTRFLGTEIAPMVTSKWNKVIKYNSAYIWFYNLNSDDTVYIVPEMLTDFEDNNKNFDPIFDESRATPVTVYTDEVN